MQTFLPPEQSSDGPHLCAWCGKPSEGQITIQPDRYAFTKPDENGKRVRYLKKAAIKADACSGHMKSLKLKDNG